MCLNNIVLQYIAREINNSSDFNCPSPKYLKLRMPIQNKKESNFYKNPKKVMLKLDPNSLEVNSDI